jgi:hypothetical protein
MPLIVSSLTLCKYLKMALLFEQRLTFNFRPILFFGQKFVRMILFPEQGPTCKAFYPGRGQIRKGVDWGTTPSQLGHNLTHNGVGPLSQPHVLIFAPSKRNGGLRSREIWCCSCYRRCLLINLIIVKLAKKYLVLRSLEEQYLSPKMLQIFLDCPFENYDLWLWNLNNFLVSEKNFQIKRIRKEA